MKYKVLWHEDALRDLKHISKNDALNIVNKVENYLSHEPFQLGKPLRGHLKGFYRYRIGKYRVIYSIKNLEITILIFQVGKRDIIYKK